jgi:hypothetical protein
VLRGAKFYAQRLPPALGCRSLVVSNGVRCRPVFRNVPTGFGRPLAVMPTADQHGPRRDPVQVGHGHSDERAATARFRLRRHRRVVGSTNGWLRWG